MDVTWLDPRPGGHPTGWVRRRRTEPAGTDHRVSRQQAEDLWNSHGRTAYMLALALLGDETSAMRAVASGMADFARSDVSTSAPDARRSLARHIYWRSTEHTADITGTQPLPQPMVWLTQLARLQRTCLALCLFGGHSHQEVAGLLAVPPLTVARMLTSGLHELGRLSAEDVAIPV